MGRTQFSNEYLGVLPYATYKREDFILFIRLTSEEFFLLPQEERMAYADLIYGSLLDEIPSIGDTKGGMGYIDSFRYGTYFEARGYRLENYDFGIERYEIEKVAPDELAITDETFASLLRHIKTLSAAKAEAFERLMLEKYPRLKSDLENGEEICFVKDAPLMANKYRDIVDGNCFFNNWPEEVRETVLEGAMCAVKERLAMGESVTIPNLEVYNTMFTEENYIKEVNRNTNLILTKR